MREQSALAKIDLVAFPSGLDHIHQWGLNRVERVTSNYDFAMHGSDRPTQKFRRLAVRKPMRRHSASVANKMLSTMSSIVLFHLSHEMTFSLFYLYFYTVQQRDTSFTGFL
jgi:hypothetical protein